MPYAATSESELAAVSCSLGTKLGTMASFAGPHRDVANSRINDTSTSAHTRSMNGIASSTKARRMSQPIKSRFRLTLSTMTPPTEAKKNPGSTLATITSAIADPGWSPPIRRAISIMARNPIQSPNALTICAIHRRRNAGLPNTGCDLLRRASSS